MTFSQALEHIKNGGKCARTNWNGKDMYVFHAGGVTFTDKSGLHITYGEHITMRTADAKYVPWLASQTDLMADDWFFVVD